MTFVLISVLALLICFCTGLSIGVRRAVRRQIDSLVVPVPASLASPPRGKPDGPTVAASSPAAPRAFARPSFTPVQPMAAPKVAQPVAQPMAAFDDKTTADTGVLHIDGPAPQPPARTPERHVRDPETTMRTSSYTGALLEPEAPAAAAYSMGGFGANCTSALLAGRNSSFEGDAHGGASAEDELLVVNFDAPNFGAGARPPQLGHLPAGPADPSATGANAGGDGDGSPANSAAADEGEETGGKKGKGKGGKKAKLAAADEEGEEEEEEEEKEEGTKKKGKKGKEGKGEAKGKEKKKGKKDEGGEAEADAEGDGGKKKKKGKKKE